MPGRQEMSLLLARVIVTYVSDSELYYRTMTDEDRSRELINFAEEIEGELEKLNYPE